MGRAAASWTDRPVVARAAAAGAAVAPQRICDGAAGADLESGAGAAAGARGAVHPAGVTGAGKGGQVLEALRDFSTTTVRFQVNVTVCVFYLCVLFFKGSTGTYFEFFWVPVSSVCCSTKVLKIKFL
jgi:hypothetical protein